MLTNEVDELVLADGPAGDDENPREDLPQFRRHGGGDDDGDPCNFLHEPD